MENTPTTAPDLGTAAVKQTPKCRPASRWMALVNDESVIAPERKLKARVIKSQAGAPEGHLLVRDHGSAYDVPMDDEDILDLAEGNVFYTLAPCEYQRKEVCQAPAKLAWFIDDKPELTLRNEQTGRTLRELFGLAVTVRLFRDSESSHDEIISVDSKVRFEEGPVFYTRRADGGLTITVNKQTFGTNDGVKPVMTVREIGNLITDQPCEVKQLLGSAAKVLDLDEKIKIAGCEEFTVIRCNVVGGFEPERVDRELAALRGNGAEVDFISTPEPAVIYRRIPTRSGYPHCAETDVLVKIPAAFPGVMLDGAYLPSGSPLLGKAPGQPNQGSFRADGKEWELVSYHPHNGGGAPQWDPNRHGIHSYYSEILSWIHSATA